MGKVIGRNGSVAKAHAHPAQGRRGARRASPSRWRSSEPQRSTRPRTGPTRAGGRPRPRRPRPARRGPRRGPDRRPDRFDAGSVLYPEGTTTPLTVAWRPARRPRPPRPVPRGPRPRERPRTLRERYLEAPSPPTALPAGAFYWHEIDGRAGRDLDGRGAGRGRGRLPRRWQRGLRGPRRPRGEILVPAVAASSASSRRRRADRRRREALGLDDRRAAIAGAWPRATTPRRAQARAIGRAGEDRGAGRRGRPPAERPGGMTLRIDVITLFPGCSRGRSARASRAAPSSAGWPSSQAHDLREWGLGRHRSVDDYPYGGGAGMILRAEPIAAALDAVAPADRRDADPARPGRRAVRPGARAASSRRASTWCSCARATRASTTACARWSTSSCRSATTCCPAASCRRWSSSTPCCGCCRAPSTRRRPWTSRSPTGCWSTRSTRARRSSRACGVPEVLLSGHHGAVARWRARAGARADAPRPARTCCRRRRDATEPPSGAARGGRPDRRWARSAGPACAAILRHRPTRRARPLMRRAASRPIQ